MKHLHYIRHICDYLTTSTSIQSTGFTRRIDDNIRINSDIK